MIRRAAGWRFMFAAICFGFLTALMFQQAVTEPEPRKPRVFTVRLEKP